MGEACRLELDRAFAAAITDSGLLAITSQCFPGHANEFFLDFYVRNAIVLGQMAFEEQRKLLDFYRNEQVRMQATNEERDSDVTKLKELYLGTGLESVRLHLASCWEALLLSHRIELAQRRAIDILERSLNSELRP